MTGASALAVLNAERIKLTTLRSPILSVALVASFSVGLAAMQPRTAALSVVAFGVPVLMVVAALTVTGEYRTRMIATTFLATPARSVVLGAKAVVAAVFCAVAAAVMVIGSLLVAREPLAVRTVAAIALYAALAAVLGVGVGALLRHSAGAVSVLLLWPLLVETLVGNLPGRGPQIGPYLPFANMFRFLDVQWLFSGYAWHWGPLGSLAYFTALVAVVFGAAVFVVNRRDA
ncbi:ABC transporter permease [Mycolicibacterium rufum]|uniref:ABC transporter permease n=1 Tax=Mycolicibacterium rufum TaxID=318424 RepID=A0A9X2YDF6_9MYCO|nr:ABC transporter permease [Mycolicibacterium rufum]KGI66586.1 ABC transporter permease [Mycolicibacterium rufum]MCV7071300.1 ABC transporter permease [Mycolicibacterium rufum]ULP37356.1 ABC transporter permease [Mycolicibacterium rufum]